ncbi:hypothetical protein D3C85_538390 [compost metagenome]
MNYIKETLCRIILLADNRPSFTDKISYFFNLIGALAPVAYLLDGLNLWFATNQQFSSFILICLMVNLCVGAVFHNKMGTFDWVELFKKNVLMWVVLIVVYSMLEMLRLTAGNNFVGEGFKVLIQVMTLLYPISKALKNIYILSNKQFPPAFIMDKIYNFEKNGDLKDFFDTDKKEE